MQQTPPAPAPYQPSYPATTHTNTMAVVSLAFGIGSWFILPLVGGVVAIVTGHIARHEIEQTREQGDTLALVGMILGYLHLAVVGLLILLVVLFFAGAAAVIVGHGAVSH